MAHEYKTESSEGESSYEIVEWREFLIPDLYEGVYICDSDDETESSDSEDHDADHEFEQVGESSNNVPEHETIISPIQAVKIKKMLKEAILPFLPAKSLTKFKAVSKEWKRWIAHPFLAHKQSYCFKSLSGYFCQSGSDTPTFQAMDPACHGVPSPSMDFLPQPVLIKGSCNGLLLCKSCNTDDSVYYVCNPANKEWQNIPPSSYSQKSPPVLIFEPSELNIAANYSLVCAFNVTGSPAISFEVYSSETGSWNTSSAYCLELGEDVVLEDGFYMKGGVFWRASSGYILIFNVKNDTHGIIPLAVQLDGLLTWLNGGVCYVRAHISHKTVCVIETYRGMSMRLKRRIELELGREVEGGCQVLACGDGRVVVLRIGNVVYSCDMEMCGAKVISKRVDRDIRYLPYVNSLVSIAHQG